MSTPTSRSHLLPVHSHRRLSPFVFRLRPNLAASRLLLAIKISRLLCYFSSPE